MTDYTNPSQPFAAAVLSPDEDRKWAMWSHFGGVLGFLPALIIFLNFKDRGELTRREGKEALNWQITIAIVGVVWAILLGVVSGIVMAMAFSSGDFGFALSTSNAITLLSWLPYLTNLVLSLVAGFKIKGGAAGYRYPVSLRLIK